MKDVIILPTFNERANISLLVSAIFRVAPDVHILVVDDNSPDGTASVVKEMMTRLPRLGLLRRSGKAGLGKAYIHAFQELIADPQVRTVTMMDADFSHQPEYLPAMFAASQHYDVVIGSRYAPGGGTAGWEWWRKMLSRGGNLYARLVTRLPVQDLTGGFNLIRANALKPLDWTAFDASGYAFQIELKYLLHRRGASFKEIPIIFKNRAGGESKLSSHIVREGILAPWKMIRKHRG